MSVPTPLSSYRRLIWCCLASLALLAALASAQTSATGTLEGRVSNPANNTYLENARVTIDGTGLETFTDPTGAYRFTDVPAGSRTVRAFFTGYESQSAVVNVGAGQTAQQDIQLRLADAPAERDRGPIKLAEFVVTEKQQMEGAAIAINEQRYAPNFKTIVSADEFGAASESDVGEFMKYLPGVQMGYNSGEARQIALGGADFNYTPVTFGGFAMTNSNQNGTNRGVSLESVALNNIARVEIINTPTPEQPGAALAGSVNFVPRSAFERTKSQFTFSTYVQMRDDYRDFNKTAGGREQPMRKVYPGLEFSYIVPVNRNFGFSLSGTAFKAWSERDSMANTWRGANAVTDGNAFPDTAPDRPYLTQYILRDGWLLRKRSSISLTMDYRLSRNDRISLTATRTSYNTNYDTHALTFQISRVASFGPDFTRGASGQGLLQISSPDGTRDRSITNYMPTLVYRHDGPIYKAEAGAGYAHSKDHTASADRGWFAITTATRPGVTVNFEGVDMLRPGKITVFDTAGREINPWDIANYSITTTNMPEPKGSDEKRTAYANVRRDFRVGSTPVGVKLGINLENQIRTTANPSPSNANFTYLGPDGRASSGDEGAAPFYFSEIATRHGAFGFQPVPAINNAKLFAFYQANPGAFRLDEAAAHTAAVSVGRRAEETISSAFARGDTSFFNHRLKLVGGVRAEQTNIDARGQLVDPTLNYQRDASGRVLRGANGNPLLIYPAGSLAAVQATNIELGTHVKKEYLRWFPSINASYNIRENLIARAGWHTSIGRPNFVQYSGAITLPDVETATPTSRIVLNNAGIKPWSAHTITLGLEYYFTRVGTVSVTVHRREFKNFFGTTLLPATPEFLALYELDPAIYGNFLVSTQRNLDTTARTDSFEFNYKQALTFLPQWARGVHVFANASTQRWTGVERAQLGSNSPSVVNGGVSLTRRNYSLRVDANHRGRQFQSNLTGRGIQPDTKNFEKARTYIDLTGEHVLWRQFRVFAKLRNITDEGVDVDIYGPLTPPFARFQTRQRYGSLWTFGVKGTF